MGKKLIMKSILGVALAAFAASATASIPVANPNDLPEFVDGGVYAFERVVRQSVDLYDILEHGADSANIEDRRSEPARSEAEVEKASWDAYDELKVHWRIAMEAEFNNSYVVAVETKLDRMVFISFMRPKWDQNYEILRKAEEHWIVRAPGVWDRNGPTVYP